LNTAIVAPPPARICRSLTRWPSCARAWLTDGCAALAAAALLSGAALAADTAPPPQSDPQLRTVVQQAIDDTACFSDQYDSAVWYKLMEPKLRRFVSDEAERLQILHSVYCETHRPSAAPLPPGLVLAVLEVESRFDRWAISSAGAVGLMQVMPFWPERLGLPRPQLIGVETNIRMGCAILRYYLQAERNDVRSALAHYNGSVGRRDYPDRVVVRWMDYWKGADDLGRRASL
jgi:soluble lytic murein transglycosylase-like protein